MRFPVIIWDIDGMDMLRRSIFLMFVIFPTLGFALESKLKVAHVIFRHGDRTASKNFPGLDQETIWPDGFSQLTQLGIQQATDLGVWLRSRYEGFLNKTGSGGKQVHVRSSDTDRTLMSASAVLTGLFPSGHQPIPIHTQPMFMDYQLSPDAECPEFAAIQREYLVEQFSSIFTDMPDKRYVDKLAQNTGLGDEIDIVDILGMADTLQCMRSHPELEMRVGEWMDEDLEKWIYAQRERAGRVYGSSDKAAYLTTGPLWGLIHDAHNDILNNKPTNKLHLYASHDIMLTGLLASVGVWDGLNPPYAAALMVELRELDNGQLTVQLHYRNSSDRPHAPLVLPGCTLDCPLEEFMELTAPYTFTGSLQEWQGICGAHNDPNVHLKVLTIVLAVCLLISVAWIVKLKLFPSHRTGYESLA